jgi:hypothetical protein
MTASNLWIEQFPSKEAAELESIVARFEAAWRQGQGPVIDDYLPQEPLQRQVVLIELVHADLEFRLRAGESIRVESYLQRYPDLRHERSAVAGFLAAEYSARRQREPNLGPEDYLHRFPEYRLELEALASPGRDTDCAEGKTGPGLCRHGDQAGATRLPIIPGFDILSELGRGGMGVVYEALHQKLNRRVALKMIRDAAHAVPDELNRFRREATALASLQHPNIVQIHEIGEIDGYPFFALELVPGSLDRRLQSGPMPLEEAASLVECLARAVQAAHQQNVIHRDLKPANVLLTANGTPKITDFGLAKKLDEVGQTQTGAVRSSTNC